MCMSLSCVSSSWVPLGFAMQQTTLTFYITAGDVCSFFIVLIDNKKLEKDIRYDME